MTIERRTVVVRLRNRTDLTFAEIAAIVDRSVPWCEQAYLLEDRDE
ncbi:hypothetical protein GRS48_00405 [Halorubrum sp. JWXQ-INN 858]|nr:hypothetical protein [Halorubrum sp. JWXQ-INN 858]MWV63295.1 hypothetical protein [Halorubrum sp. JWXQ-INN 858]